MFCKNKQRKLFWPLRVLYLRGLMVKTPSYVLGKNTGSMLAAVMCKDWSFAVLLRRGYIEPSASVPICQRHG